MTMSLCNYLQCGYFEPNFILRLHGVKFGSKLLYWELNYLCNYYYLQALHSKFRFRFPLIWKAFRLSYFRFPFRPSGNTNLEVYKRVQRIIFKPHIFYKIKILLPNVPLFTVQHLQSFEITRTVTCQHCYRRANDHKERKTIT
jgi:hypothetical protein